MILRVGSILQTSHHTTSFLQRGLSGLENCHSSISHVFTTPTPFPAAGLLWTRMSPFRDFARLDHTNFCSGFTMRVYTYDIVAITTIGACVNSPKVVSTSIVDSHKASPSATHAIVLAERRLSSAKFDIGGERFVWPFRYTFS